MECHETELEEDAAYIRAGLNEAEEIIASAEDSRVAASLSGIAS